MKTHAELKDELLRDPEVRREYERLGPEFELIRSLVAARARAAEAPIRGGNGRATPRGSLNLER